MAMADRWLIEAHNISSQHVAWWYSRNYKSIKYILQQLTIYQYIVGMYTVFQWTFELLKEKYYTI